MAGTDCIVHPINMFGLNSIFFKCTIIILSTPLNFYTSLVVIQSIKQLQIIIISLTVVKTIIVDRLIDCCIPVHGIFIEKSC